MAVEWGNTSEFEGKTALITGGATGIGLGIARGFAAARLEDIAHRAGCTKGTIFLYFENKEELFKALVRDDKSVEVGRRSHARLHACAV